LLLIVPRGNQAEVVPVPEVIDDGITGFIVESEEKAVREVRERFSALRMARDAEARYRKLIASRSLEKRVRSWDESERTRTAACVCKRVKGTPVGFIEADRWRVKHPKIRRPFGRACGVAVWLIFAKASGARCWSTWPQRLSIISMTLHVENAQLEFGHRRT
jgi:hypothetical protein